MSSGKGLGKVYNRWMNFHRSGLDSPEAEVLTSGLVTSESRELSLYMNGTGSGSTCVQFGKREYRELSLYMNEGKVTVPEAEVLTSSLVTRESRKLSLHMNKGKVTVPEAEVLTSSLVTRESRELSLYMNEGKVTVLEADVSPGRFNGDSNN